MSRFLDEVDIIIQSGRGGPGAVSFRREKYVPKGGPDGGDGGDGGDIIIKVKKELRSLYNKKLKRIFKGQNGQPGKGKKRKGANGEDCVIDVPPGTVILDRESKIVLADLTLDNEKIVLLKGGKGGYGNARFATSINRAPRYAQKGQPASESAVTLRLKTIADVGIVGLPNVGKSTLLSVLTDARPKIGAYPFTTLTPNLGVMLYKNEQQFILADVPGLIEGASKGYGLGIRFLKHIERTKVLLFMLDLYIKDFNGQYMAISNEMKNYSKELLEKPRLVVGNKRDIVTEREENNFLNMDLQDKKICISSVSGTGLDELKDEIVVLMEKLDENSLY
ncbi:MAG: GTPase ObgE [Spirochaetes bacterium]|nr:GTPase ObgE [Spirochaetota bacterium]